ncbi:MAG: 50S ribosomal protein L15 [Hyphomonadaceae bacterium]|nr:50S ribosomal protein L15 [Hyphomonadaceae bacterium]
MKLNEISDNPGARKKRMRVGLGVGSGKGKTAGRGVKGQKARRGVAVNGFEGGQMPIYMRLPKRGFTPHGAKSFAEVNVGKIEEFVKSGKLDAKKPIDADAMKAAGVVRRAKDGVRLLAKGEIKTKVELVVYGASAAAIKAVEKAGGKVTVTKPVAAEAAAE